MASIKLCFYDESGAEIAVCDASALRFTEEAVLERAHASYGDAELCEKRVAMIEQVLLSEAISLLSSAKRRNELPTHLRYAIHWPDCAIAICIIIR